MNDGLTRLILRAQGRMPARVVTAEPVLASRHEDNSGSAWARVEPWTAYTAESGRKESGSESISRRADEPLRHTVCEMVPPFPRSLDNRASLDENREPGDTEMALPPPRSFDKSAFLDENRGSVETDDSASAAALARPSIIGRRAEDVRSKSPNVPTGERSTALPDAPLGMAGNGSGEPLFQGQDVVATARPVTPPPAPLSPHPSALSLAARPPSTGHVPPDRVAAFAPQIRGESPSAPEVRISIGVVEVHATPPRPLPTRPPPARQPSTTLAEYLARRAGRSS
jgi:hypothetical protein